jgi:SapB morphogen precursor RamS
MRLLDLQGLEWKEEAAGGHGGDQTNLCVDVSDISVDISL